MKTLSCISLVVAVLLCALWLYPFVVCVLGGKAPTDGQFGSALMLMMGSIPCFAFAAMASERK